MKKNNAALAKAYYTAMGEKDISSIEKYLHPDVQFTGPLSSMEGKEAILEANKNFMSFFKTLKIRSAFGSEDQAVVIYDVESPVGCFPGASLMTFEEGQVIKIELIYDARPYVQKKEEIFS